MRVQPPYIHKLIEVVVVCQDKNFIFATLWIVPLSVKDFNNSQKLIVVENKVDKYTNNIGA